MEKEGVRVREEGREGERERERGTVNDRTLPMMIRLSYNHRYHEENPPGIPRY